MLRRFFSSITYTIAMILELLPNGVIMLFGNPSGDPYIEKVSYFSTLPFGYGNVFPLITAVLTCILFLLSIISVLVNKKKLHGFILLLTIVACIMSFLPFIIFGVDCITVIGIIISVLLFIQIFSRAKILRG